MKIERVSLGSKQGMDLRVIILVMNKRQAPNLSGAELLPVEPKEDSA